MTAMLADSRATAAGTVEARHRWVTTARYLGLLLLLTPLLAGFRLLAVREGAPPAPEVVTQVIEVPRFVTEYVEVTRPVYVEVLVPSAAAAAEAPDVTAPMRRTAETELEVADAAPNEAGDQAAAEEPQASPEGVTVADLPAESVMLASAEPVFVRTAARSNVIRVQPLEPAADPPPADASGVEAAMAVASGDDDEALVDEMATDQAADPARQAAQRELDAFNSFVARTWSARGYSSEAEMREELGNSQTGWLDRLEQAAASAEPSRSSVELSLAPRAASPADEGDEAIIEDDGDDEGELVAGQKGSTREPGE